MKLSKNALLKINNTMTRLHIAIALGFSEQWVINLIKNNKENSPLTTALALSIIRKETGLNDNEMLDVEAIEV